jgi:flagellar hook-associated protein 3 FlgL
MEKLQTQSATLRKVNAPSDDPVGAAKIMEIRTDKVNNDQYMMNAKLAETFLEGTDHALADLGEILIRAKEIAINQSSGASSNDETRLGVAEEISQLYRQAVATANWKVGDRYLLGGYKTHKPPVGPEGEYLGDDGQMMVEVAKDVFLTMNVPGVEAFNTQPRSEKARMGYSERRPAEQGESGVRSGSELRNSQGELLQTVDPNEPLPENVNLFKALQNLRIGLLTGDLESIRSTLEQFDQIHSQVVATRSKLGSRMAGLRSTQQAMERHNITAAELSSALEDADMAQVVSDLAKEETVFRSALASSQKLIQPTLMDFIR